MSNRSDLKKQSLLQSTATSLTGEALTDRAAARAPSPLGEAQQKEATDYFKFLEDPNHDFTKLAPLAYSGMFEDGAAGAEESRTALGAGRFGTTAADPNLQAVLASNEKERRVQRRGESLERAAGMYDAKIRAVSSELAARDQQRRMGSAGLTTGAATSANNSFAAYQPRPHWGISLATAGIGALGQAFTGSAA
jgi:hypothetical protein